MHVIEIIKNGYNPKERPEPIFWYQPSRSFGVSLAFSNLVMCPSTQMHIDALLGSEQASWKLSSHAASACFSDPGTDLKAAPVAVLQSQVPIIMSLAYLRNSLNIFVGQVLPSGKGQKCIVACTCRSWTINSAKRIDSKHTHRNPEYAWKEQDLTWVLILAVTAKACVDKNHIYPFQTGSAFLGRRHAAWGKILLQHAACQSMTSKGLNVKL